MLLQAGIYLHSLIRRYLSCGMLARIAHAGTQHGVWVRYADVLVVHVHEAAMKPCGKNNAALSVSHTHRERALNRTTCFAAPALHGGPWWWAAVLCVVRMALLL